MAHAASPIRLLNERRIPACAEVDHAVADDLCLVGDRRARAAVEDRHGAAAGLIPLPARRVPELDSEGGGVVAAEHTGGEDVARGLDLGGWPAVLGAGPRARVHQRVPVVGALDVGQARLVEVEDEAAIAEADRAVEDEPVGDHKLVLDLNGVRERQVRLPICVFGSVEGRRPRLGRRLSATPRAPWTGAPGSIGLQREVGRGERRDVGVHALGAVRRAGDGRAVGSGRPACRTRSRRGRRRCATRSPPPRLVPADRAAHLEVRLAGLGARVSNPRPGLSAPA